MRVDLDTGKYNVVIDSSNFDVSIESGAKLDVNIGESARIDVNSAVTYIKSGKKEIDTYVDSEVKPDILEYSKVESRKFIDSYVGATVEEYVEEVTKPCISEFADSKISEYNTLAQTSEETLIQYVDSASLSAKNAKDSADVSTAQASISTAQAVISTTKASESLASANASANSAKQCQAIKDSLGTVYVFKGSVANTSSLPTNAKVGDVYDVTESGNNYAWTGNSWDSLGVNVDLSNYALKSDLNTKQDKLTAGTGIKIENNVVSNTQTSAEWGNIQGTLSNQTDLQNALNGKANLNLGNSTAITNCITEIPQDIKLELNNGTLILKAGSVLYEPNGANNFIKHTTTQDYSWAWGNNRFIILPQKNGNMGQSSALAKAFSGATAPTTPSDGAIWYDTTNNVIKRYNSTNGWVAANFCLPVAITTNASDKITSIDQIFNGFGYIGSTVFALPGVKGLIPNGRNTDGTLKNTEIVISNVGTKQVSGSFTMEVIVGRNSYMQYNPITTVRNASEISSIGWYYSIEDNILGVYTPSTQTWTQTNSYVIGGTVDFVDSKITSFTPKLPFRAVDYSDSSWIAQQAMPSGKYIDLTLGASGSSYTAPANGYFFLGANTNGVNNEIVFYDTSNASGYAFSQAQSNYPVRCMQAVRKGVALRIDYVGIKTPVVWFRFIYAEGEK